MKTKLLILQTLFLLICFSNSLYAQRPFDLAQRAMSQGKYDEAISYFQKAYEINPDESITKMINLAQTLKTEFDAVDEAIKRNDFDQAEKHLNNVLIADPGNTIVEKKREEMRIITSNQKKAKRRARSQRFVDGFLGSDDKHEYFGGMHFSLGGSMTNIGNVISSTGLGMQMEYGNYKTFPFNINLNGVLTGDVKSVGAGVGSSYLIADNFSVDYGLGWQNLWWNSKKANHFYYNVGLTYMFDGTNWGGIRYSYNHSIGSPAPITTHKLTYVFGKMPTLVVLEFSLLIGGGIAYFMLRK